MCYLGTQHAVCESTNAAISDEIGFTAEMNEFADLVSSFRHACRTLNNDQVFFLYTKKTSEFSQIYNGYLDEDEKKL